MNDVLYNTLVKITTVSQIRAGQKLDTTNSVGLTIYTDSFANWIMRKYHRDSKNDGIRVLKEVYKSLDDQLKQVTDVDLLTNIASEIRKSVEGIANLRITYKLFPHIISEIDALVTFTIIPLYKRINTTVGGSLESLSWGV